MLRHVDDAEEAAQEALIRAWRRRDSCRTPEAPVPWMMQIARNEALRALEGRDRRRAREDLEPDAEAAPAEDPDLEGVVGCVTVEQALSGLSEEERTLVNMRYVDDLSQPEIARLLAIPEGTVKVRLHRIRKRLRSELKDEV